MSRKSYTHRVLQFVMALCLGGCALGLAVEIPWKTADEMAKDVQDQTMVACGPDIPVVFLKLAKDGVDYLLFYSPQTHRFVLAKMGPDRPTHLYWGRVVAPQAPLIVLGNKPFTEEDMSSGPCALLIPKETQKGGAVPDGPSA